MANNDTYIEQEDFCKNIVNEYKNNKFHVCGPNIISLVDNKKQNPIPKLFHSIKDVKVKIIKFRILLLLSFVRADTLLMKFVDYRNSKKGKKRIASVSEEFQIHGSCMIFSPMYIRNYEGLCDRTFMYVEESFLKFISDRDNLNMIYSENIVIYHKEDSATNASMNKEYMKRRFYYENSIKSCSELIKLMKGIVE